MGDRSCSYLVPAGEVAVVVEALPDPSRQRKAAVAAAAAAAEEALPCPPHVVPRLHPGPARFGWHL